MSLADRHLSHRLAAKYGTGGRLGWQSATSCNLVRMKRKLPELSYDMRVMPEPLKIKKFALIAEERLDDVLRRHPEWEKAIRADVADSYHAACILSEIEKNIMFEDENGIGECEIELEQITQGSNDAPSYSDMEKDAQKGLQLDIMDFGNNLYDYLCLTILKRNFTVYKNFKDGSSRPSFTLKHDNSDNMKFPVEPFFYPTEKNPPLCVIKELYINYYNHEHVFSRWLIEKREELQEKIPSIYNSILATMILEKYAGVIISSINTILDKLKNFWGNPLGVDDTLYLSKSDFTVEDDCF